MLKLSDEALGAVMMALQRSLMEQSDIVPMLQELDFVTSGDNELSVTNPPTLHVDEDKLDKSALENNA